MHIVHVVRQFHPAIGGFESVCLELATAQVAAGHNVRIVTLNRLFKSQLSETLPAREQHDGIDIIRVPFCGSSRYPIAPSVLRHLGKADIVHVHAIDFFFDFLGWTKPVHRRKLVVSTHGGFFHTGYAARFKQIYFQSMTRLSLSWYDGVAAVSAADFDMFSAIRHRGMICIENGVNTAKYAGAGAIAPCKTIICISRFAQNKRLDLLIRFVAELKRKDPEWQLLIAGRPWDLSADQLRLLAMAEGVGDTVIVFENPTDADLRNLMKEASIIASSSDYEGFGISIVEGMAAGLYPVLQGIPPFTRLVSQHGIGLILDFEQTKSAVAEFLQRWTKITVDYSSFRTRSMLAAKTYDWGKITRVYQNLYEDAIGLSKRTILDVHVLTKTASRAVEHIDECVSKGSSTIVAFANAHALNVASKNSYYRQILKTCLVLNDGVGINTASKILYGSGFPQNLNGSDFIPGYFKATRHSYRIFLLGAHPAVVERAAQRLQELCPQHMVVGARHGYFDSGANQLVVEEIRASKADVILVGMGIPLQEKWLVENLPHTCCRLGFGVGALFDFLAGKFPRAPGWLRYIQMEWIYRFALEPRRLFRRYAVGNPAFLMRVLAQWLSGARV